MFSFDIQNHIYAINIHFQVQPVNKLTQFTGCSYKHKQQQQPCSIQFYGSSGWRSSTRSPRSPRDTRVSLYSVSPQLLVSCHERYRGLQVNVHGCTHMPPPTHPHTHPPLLGSSISSCFMHAHTQANVFLTWPNSPFRTWFRPSGPTRSQFAGHLFINWSVPNLGFPRLLSNQLISLTRYLLVIALHYIYPPLLQLLMSEKYCPLWPSKELWMHPFFFLWFF